MPSFDRGDVVVVPFPFVDASLAKRRPALILSGRSFNRENGHLLCAMITTATHSRWPSDHPIADLDSAGLAHASVVRFKLFTLPDHLIVRALGRMAGLDWKPVEAILSRVFFAA